MLETREPKKRSKLILVLFLATAMMSLGFWFWGDLGKSDLKNPLWEGVTVKMNFLSEEEKAAKASALEDEKFKKSLQDEINGKSGTYGIFVYRLVGKEKYGVNEEVVMPAASILKLPVMIATIQEIEAGRLSFESTYSLEARDRRTGSGPLGTLALGTKFTIERLLSEMGKKSDNTAYAAMLRKLGPEVVQEKIGEWGLVNTSVEANTTTPRDVGLLWQKIYKDELISVTDKEKLWDDLRDSIYEDRLPAGLPKGIDVVHKVGTDEGVWSDSGIVLGEKSLVMVIMTRDAKREEAMTVVPELARMIWEFESGRK